MLMCRDLARIASDYIDGELGPMDTVSVKMHLLMCGHCRTFIGNLRHSVDLMKAHSSQHVDEELVRRIDERVTESLNARNSDNGKSY
ncbi:zf-HC2 domain-containing protein [Marinobacter sp. ATCH36]|uniref:zf-HC2 domain-containing protein n=1 Tax=Marinobacter sp. ATCH36 TaxID=2945106 RepID=UPI002021A00A|nr:zf-HC2 domain-containing protein [Marinobacter sp. ATCH36]MCL7942608.1 zf-HC2 domain-containing protein [Marinobacter sp. ATCH36]